MKSSTIIKKLFFIIKKEEHKFNYDFSITELGSILFSKGLSLLRGMIFIKHKLRKSKGLIFAEKRTRIIHGKKITCGSNMNLQSYSEINGLCKNGVQIGDNFTLGKFAIIECTGVLRNVGDELIIGNNVGINHYCFIGVRGSIVIKDNVIFGPRVSVFSENHNFLSTEVPIKNQGVTKGKTIIDEDVWIGANSSILSGVHIGKGCVIAAGSVVTKDIPPFSIAAGVPAKVIKNRKESKS